MAARTGRGLLIVVGIMLFGLAMFAAGWSLAARPASAVEASVSAPVQANAPTRSVVPVQGVPPIQEFIPLPGPDQGPGQGPAEQCEPVILFYHEGRLYQLMPGPQQDQGRPTSPPEYFPIRPYQGPQIPGLPFQLPPGQVPRVPQGPGFQPVQPRF